MLILQQPGQSPNARTLPPPPTIRLCRLQRLLNINRPRRLDRPPCQPPDLRPQSPDSIPPPPFLLQPQHPQHHDARHHRQRQHNRRHSRQYGLRHHACSRQYHRHPTSPDLPGSRRSSPRKSQSSKLHHFIPSLRDVLAIHVLLLPTSSRQLPHPLEPPLHLLASRRTAAIRSRHESGQSAFSELVADLVHGPLRGSCASSLRT